MKTLRSNRLDPLWLSPYKQREGEREREREGEGEGEGEREREGERSKMAHRLIQSQKVVITGSNRGIGLQVSFARLQSRSLSLLPAFPRPLTTSLLRRSL